MSTIEFQKKQIQETREKYFPIFDMMLNLAPSEYIPKISIVRDEIRRLIERYSTIIELQEGKIA